MEERELEDGKEKRVWESGGDGRGLRKWEGEDERVKMGVRGEKWKG